MSFFLALKIRLNFLASFCLSAMFVDSFVSRFLLHLLHRCRFFSSFFLFARGFFFWKFLFSCRRFQNPDAASLTQRRRRSYGPRCQSRPFRLAFSREGKTVLWKRPCAAVACPFMDIIFFPLSSPPARPPPGHLWNTNKIRDRPQHPPHLHRTPWLSPWTFFLLFYWFYPPLLLFCRNCFFYEAYCFLGGGGPGGVLWFFKVFSSGEKLVNKHYIFVFCDFLGGYL